jgi:2,3-bisphosphoglycerate-dependent phosphoglycerate mutase
LTRLVVVRHGETAWNLEARIQGHGDSALTAKGLAQAGAIAGRLAGEPFDALVSSDLGRALQTAQRIAAAMNREVVADARFRERSFGCCEGLTYAELHERFPDGFGRHLQDNDPDFRIPEAETRREFYARIARAFEELADEHPDRHVLVVCHGGVLAALFRHVHGIPAGEPQAVDIPNAAYNSVVRGPSGWRIEAWADIAHLADIGGEGAASRGSALARMS